jgi:hypothetical protein
MGVLPRRHRVHYPFCIRRFVLYVTALHAVRPVIIGTNGASRQRKPITTIRVCEYHPT